MPFRWPRSRPFLKQLSVVDSIDQLPYVAGLEEERLRVTSGSAVYVRLADAQLGQRWAVVRPCAMPSPSRPRT